MYKAKTFVNYISSDFKCQLNSTTCNSDKKWNSDTCQCQSKKFRSCRKDYSWNAGTCICENGKYLKSIAGTSLNVCDEIKNATDSIPTNVTNNISTNMINTISTNVPNEYCANKF